MSEKVMHVSQEDFDKEVLKQSGPVLVDFWADWCGPCRMLAPTIDAVADEMADKVKVCKVNVDSAHDLAKKYGIMTIPTVIVFKNGEEKERSVGLVNKSAIITLLQKYI
ncbi:MAG: thioredoxin [Eubacteriales bacterium]